MLSASGSPTNSANAKRVLFLYGDGQVGGDETSNTLSIYNSEWDGYSDLAQLLLNDGFEISELNVERISVDTLNDVDVIVFTTFWRHRYLTDTEASVLSNYISDGGGMFLIGELSRDDLGNYHRVSVNKIGKFLGLDFRHDLICDPGSNDGDYDTPIIRDISSHDVTSNIVSFLLNWGSSLDVSNPAQAIAFTTSQAWSDTNARHDRATSTNIFDKDSNEPNEKLIALAAGQYGSGRFVAIGDASWMCNTWINREDNTILVKNIFNWLSKIPIIENQPPKASKIEPSDKIDIVVGEEITFRIKVEDPNDDADLHMVQWFIDNKWYVTSLVDKTTGEASFSYTFENPGTFSIKATAYDEHMGEDSVTWTLITRQNTADTMKYDCNSFIYINDEIAACIKAEVVNEILRIDIYPQEGWGIPNRASLVEMMGLELKPVPVGQVILGYDEDISVFVEDIQILYAYEGNRYHSVITEGTSELPTYVDPLISDLMSLGNVWIPTNIIFSSWTGFTDQSTKPTEDYFTDDNEYDACIIIWPDQSVKFSGDIIDKAYVDSPNYISLEVGVDLDNEADTDDKYIYIYVKNLITRLHDYGGIRVGDYAASTYANCEVFKVPIN